MAKTSSTKETQVVLAYVKKGSLTTNKITWIKGKQVAVSAEIAANLLAKFPGRFMKIEAATTATEEQGTGDN